MSQTNQPILNRSGIAEAAPLMNTSTDNKEGRLPPMYVRSYQHRLNQIWSDTWTIEVIALTLCIICALSTCIMLGVLDNEPLPPMPKGLTMNAIISILSTIAKSSLLLAVSSCISQLKWKWYRTSRGLSDIQLFEDASRGPFGALQMLLRHRGSSTACIGASILVLALLFDPFTQQVLTYPSKPQMVPSDSAIVNSAHAFFRCADAHPQTPPA